MTTHSESVTTQPGCSISKDKDLEIVSLKGGYWFYFQDGDDEIAIFGSGWSGKEIVYFNDNPVSEARNLKFISNHEFSKGGKDYRIVYKVESMWRGEVHCSLYINDKLHDTQKKAVMVKSAKSVWKAISFYFVIGFIFGFLGTIAIKFL